MLTPKVSVIIPARNEEKYLEKTIESVKKQKYKNIEVVVVNNGSRDKTFEIAKLYSDKTISFDLELGIGGARNEGVKLTDGDILVFLDADTYLSPNAIKNIVDYTTFNTVGTCKGVPATKDIIAKLFFLGKNFLYKNKIIESAATGIIFCHRKIFNEINGFNPETHAELIDFINKVIKMGGKYKFLDNCYVTTSMRRYEKDGYFKTTLFWFKWKIISIFNKKDLVKNFVKYKIIR